MKPKVGVKSFVAPLMEDLCVKGNNADITIYKDILAVFQEFVFRLGEDLCMYRK